MSVHDLAQHLECVLCVPRDLPCDHVDEEDNQTPHVARFRFPVLVGEHFWREEAEVHWVLHLLAHVVDRWINVNDDRLSIGVQENVARAEKVRGNAALVQQLEGPQQNLPDHNVRVEITRVPVLNVFRKGDTGHVASNEIYCLGCFDKIAVRHEELAFYVHGLSDGVEKSGRLLVAAEVRTRDDFDDALLGRLQPFSDNGAAENASVDFPND